MRGISRREKIVFETAIAQAWHTENFRRVGKKLKNLDHYLKKLRQQPVKRVQTADEVLAVFQSLAASRGGITIRERGE